MIQQGTALFNIPPKLATDIRAYLAERERRKLSPKKEVDKCITVVVICVKFLTLFLFQSMGVAIGQSVSHTD
jgi:hypothetical protein